MSHGYIKPISRQLNSKYPAMVSLNEMMDLLFVYLRQVFL